MSIVLPIAFYHIYVKFVIFAPVPVLKTKMKTCCANHCLFLIWVFNCLCPVPVESVSMLAHLFVSGSVILYWLEASFCENAVWNANWQIRSQNFWKIRLKQTVKRSLWKNLWEICRGRVLLFFTTLKAMTIYTKNIPAFFVYPRFEKAERKCERSRLQRNFEPWKSQLQLNRRSWEPFEKSLLVKTILLNLKILNCLNKTGGLLEI